MISIKNYQLDSTKNQKSIIKKKLEKAKAKIRGLEEGIKKKNRELQNAQRLLHEYAIARRERRAHTQNKEQFKPAGEEYSFFDNLSRIRPYFYLDDPEETSVKQDSLEVEDEVVAQELYDNVLYQTVEKLAKLEEELAAGQEKNESLTKYVEKLEREIRDL